MAIIQINSIDLPTPTDMQIGIMDLSKAERNANGTMIIERITTKRKIELQYKYLSKEELTQVLSIVSTVFFIVTYTDPQTATVRTGTFYCGDRSAGLIDFNNGIPRYKDVKFNLIER
jgi:hypothetical protein